MTFDFFEIFLLSTIQGISEFIPVSSSAHLFLISDFYNFKVQSLLTDIGLHLGSLLAIITYFHSDLSNILKNKNLLLLMIFGFFKHVPLTLYPLLWNNLHVLFPIPDSAPVMRTIFLLEFKIKRLYAVYSYLF